MVCESFALTIRNLAKNRLTSLPMDTFANLTSLQELYVLTLTWRQIVALVIHLHSLDYSHVAHRHKHPHTWQFRISISVRAFNPQHEETPHCLLTVWQTLGGKPAHSCSANGGACLSAHIVRDGRDYDLCAYS